MIKKRKTVKMGGKDSKRNKNLHLNDAFLQKIIKLKLAIQFLDVLS